jgi:hypothetical protein
MLVLKKGLACSNLEDFSMPYCCHTCSRLFDSPPIQLLMGATAISFCSDLHFTAWTQQRRVIPVEGMTCAHCANPMVLDYPAVTWTEPGIRWYFCDIVCGRAWRAARSQPIGQGALAAIPPQLQPAPAAASSSPSLATGDLFTEKPKVRTIGRRPRAKKP